MFRKSDEMRELMGFLNLFRKNKRIITPENKTKKQTDNIIEEKNWIIKRIVRKRQNLDL